MQDIYHYFGADIGVASNGDLQAVDGVTKSQQRVLRRLLTAPGAYIFHPTYGAGLGGMIGDVIDVAKIRAVIRGQILLEASVAPSPVPVITVTAIPYGVSVTIKYTVAPSQIPVVLSFNVDR